MARWTQRLGRRSAEKHPIIWSILGIAIWGGILFYGYPSFDPHNGSALIAVLIIGFSFVWNIVRLIKSCSAVIKRKKEEKELDNKEVIIINDGHSAYYNSVIKPNIGEHHKINSNIFSSADEIRQYKELLDCGIITQEEFDAKKKQLLDL